jgi:hypothetical protein
MDPSYNQVTRRHSRGSNNGYSSTSDAEKIGQLGKGCRKKYPVARYTPTADSVRGNTSTESSDLEEENLTTELPPIPVPTGIASGWNSPGNEN